MIDLSQYPILKDDLTAGVTNAEYLVSIDSGSTQHPNIYIGTKKQMFVGRFYEDRDLKVSRISEKVDIRTKKIQLSNINITLTNFPISANKEDRLSNNPALVIGAHVNVLLKTQSCQNINDCMRVARLKITRIEHDEKKIKINADDISLQAFSQSLPQDKYVLEQGKDTFEHYDSKPVPILYGHLQAAPAIVYVEDMLLGYPIHAGNNIKVLVDTSYLNPSTTKICGIKSLGFMGHINGENTNSPTNYYPGEPDDPGGEIIYGKFLTDNDALKVGIDDQFCSVLATPSWNASYALVEAWNQVEAGEQFGNQNIYTHPQYVVDGYGVGAFYDDSAVSMNSITLITKTTTGVYPSKATLLTKGAMWVSHLANYLAKDAMVLNTIAEIINGMPVKNYYHGVVNNQVEEGDGYTEFLNIHTSADFGYGGEGNIADYEDQKSNLAIETLEFEQFSGADVYSIIDGEGSDLYHPSDVSFTGKHKLISEKGDLFDSVGNIYSGAADSAETTAYQVSVFGFPSGYVKDEDAHGVNSFDDDQSNWVSGLITTSTEMGYPEEIGFILNNLGWENNLGSDFMHGFDEQLWEKLSDTIGVNQYPTTPFYYNQTSEIRQGGSHTSSQSFLYGELFYSAGISTGDYKPFGYYSNYYGTDRYYTAFSPMNTTQISFYMMNNPGGALVGDVNLKSYWGDVKLKKTWAENNIFAKDFFVNARGKKSENIPWYSSFHGITYLTKRVSGIIEVLWAMENSVPVEENINFGMSKTDDNTHFEKLHKILTNRNLETKEINGKLYERMLVSETQMPDQVSITKSYLYDIELQNLGLTYGRNGNGDSLLIGQPPGGTETDVGDAGQNFILHDKGWDIRFSAYLFGNTPEISTTVEGAFAGVRLVWGRKNYAISDDGATYISSITESSEEGGDFEKFNDRNGCPQGTVSNFYGGVPLARKGYTMVYWNSSNVSHQTLAENPATIIKDLVENELRAPSQVEARRYTKALTSEQNNKFAFSINESVPAKNVIENICKQSRLLFRNRVSDGTTIIDTIRNTYNNGDVDKLIDSDMILKYQFTKTKIEDLCFGGVSVRYGYNYLTKEYDGLSLKRVLEDDVSSFKNLYSVDNHEDYILEIDAPYIQDGSTAKILGNYLYELHKNQHLICKLTLPLKEGVELEVGDIVRFSKDPHGVKPFGKPVTSSHSIGETGQKALPYFMVTSASKSLTEVSLELYQLNRLKIITLNPTLLGDVNLNGWVNDTDVNLITDYIDGLDTDISEQGLANADIDGDGFVTISDANAIAFLPHYIEGEDEDMGELPSRDWDVNGDDQITVSDFQAIWQHVVSNNSGTVDAPETEYIMNADVDNDGVVSWQDYIAGLDAYPSVASQLNYDSIPGDIDGDGEITSADLIYLQLHLYGFEIQQGNPHYVNLPDFNNDGVTDSSDYDILVNLINGNMPSVIGDLNLDGEVDIRDIILYVKIFDGIFTPNEYQIQNGDINGDGVIDVVGQGLGYPADLTGYLTGDFVDGINYFQTSEFQDGFINGELITQTAYDQLGELFSNTNLTYLNGEMLEAFVHSYQGYYNYEITIQDYANLLGGSESMGLLSINRFAEIESLLVEDGSGSDSDAPEGYFELASSSHGTDLELNQASLINVTLGKYYLDSGIDSIVFKFDKDYIATSDSHNFAPSANWYSLYTKIHNSGSHSLGVHSSSSGHEEKTDLIIRTSFIGSDEDWTFIQNYQNGQRLDVCEAFLALDGMTVRSCRIQPSGSDIFFRLEADTIEHPEDFNWITDESFSLGGVVYDYGTQDTIPSNLAMFFKIDIYAPQNYWEQ